MIVRGKRMMTKIPLILWIGIFSICTSCDEAESPSGDLIDSPVARASINGMFQETDSTYLVDDQPYGEALFFDEDTLIRLEINLLNFSPNTNHAIHIHNGSCEQPGMHWNQNQGMDMKFCGELSLGIPWAKPYAGDVGNLSVDYAGNGSLTLKTNLWRIGSNDDKDLNGRSIVIHETLSDFNGECDPFHDHFHAHNNPKIACGLITHLQEKE